MQGQREQAAGGVHAGEQSLRAVVANAPIVLFAVDQNGVFTLSEGGALRLNGIEPGQHVGQSYFMLYGHLPESIAAMRRALAGEETVTLNEFNGIVFETRWTPIRDADGQPNGVIGVCADVTDRARLEQERSALHQRTHEALDALLQMAEVLVQGGHMHTDAADTAPEVQPEAQRLAALTRSVLGCRRVSITAYDAATGQTRPLAAVGVTDDEERAWRSGLPGAALREYLDSDQAARLQSDGVLVLDAANVPGQRLPYGARTLLLALMRVDAQVVGVLALDHGTITHTYTPDELALARAVARLSGFVMERERLLREREDARTSAAALRESNRRMDEFLGIAGHEIRTPLTALGGQIQLARRRLARLAAQPDPSAAELVSGVTTTEQLLARADVAMARLTRLVGDLLDVSRIHADGLEIRPALRDVGALVRKVVEEHRELYAPRTIRLLEPPPDPLRALVDEDRIEQVLSNYLSNAIKYAPPERPVTVGIDTDGALVRVWVRDEGAGIPAAALPHIWERFYRVQDVEQHHGSSVGLGLGLHISRGIVERHSGSVGVESTPGAGSTFWFAVPRASGV